MTMKKKKEQALIFAYNVMYDRHKELNNSRSPYRQIGLAIIETYMETMQKIMKRDHKMKVNFKPFPKWKQSHASE